MISDRHDDMVPIKRPAAVRRPADVFLAEKPFRRNARPVKDAALRMALQLEEDLKSLTPLENAPFEEADEGAVPGPGEIPAHGTQPLSDAPAAEKPAEVPPRDIPVPENLPEVSAPEPSAAENSPEASAPDTPAAQNPPETPAPEPQPDPALFQHDFDRRLAQRRDELKWLFCELYDNNMEAYLSFENMLREAWAQRKDALRSQDAHREKDPDWYRHRSIVGMMLYVDAFAGTLRGVEQKLPYLQECGVSYLHLMPLLLSPKGRSDGGYAVADFRTVQPELGTMEDLESLADACRAVGISVCMDFVMNHTSEDHQWARKARAGEPGYRERYFFYDSWDLPREIEKTIPQVFPTTAPGSFTELPDCGQIVMTNFYPYQWDLNYANPVVFRDMTENLLYLANRGMDVIRLDAIPYIWKEPGTDCRNLPQVHSLARMMRLACEIVCPSVLLLGEVVMEPRKVAPYFGTPEKPECHMLYNVTTMCTTWHTLATGNPALLKRQMEILSTLPKDFLFLNYLRCHDDIGWGLDYPWLWQHFGEGEVSHKKFLNDWFTGRWPGSPSRGELYNDDPRLGDARLCGTTASLTGLESAVRSGTPEDVDLALTCILTLNAWMFSQSGIPVIYSGDEVGRFNDWSYHDDPDKAADSRYIHRGRFQWDLAALRTEKGTYQQRLFDGMRQLETIRAQEPCFDADADFSVVESGSNRILAISRRKDGRELICLYNFGPEPATASVLREGGYINLVTGEPVERLRAIHLGPRSFAWMLRA